MIEKELGTCILHKNCRGVDTRVVGHCIRCNREVSMGHGHLAPAINKDTLVCARCLAR